MTEPVMEKVIDRLAALFKWGVSWIKSVDEPDACLIAAAPELLRLLKGAIEEHQPDWVTNDWRLEALDVIAKAEGRRE